MAFPALNPQSDSTDVTAADRQRMAQAVWQNREKFDGFVLTHGTDTLAYTAALLTHLLPHFDKPLVLTGSMLPMGVPDSDAPRNLLDAFRTAADGRAGVYAVMNGQKIERYVDLFKATHGGITFSGGESMMQPAFVSRVFHAAKEMGVHTCLDTSGFLNTNYTDEMLEDIDLCLLDVKSGDEETYHKVTGGTLQPTIDFGQRLAKAGKKIWVRFVLVPGLTDSEENVENVAKICESFGDAVEHIDVLGFHQLGRPKWHELRIPYPLENQKGPNAATRERVTNQFKDHGFTVY